MAQGGDNSMRVRGDLETQPLTRSDRGRGELRGRCVSWVKGGSGALFLAGVTCGCVGITETSQEILLIGFGIAAVAGLVFCGAIVRYS